MNSEMVVQYVGFTTNGSSREYTFNVRDVLKETRQFKIAIPNEAFNSRRARFQDGPDICSHRLQRELASGAESLASTYEINDTDLENYRIVHSPQPGHRRWKPAKTL